jgi:hypothetical protein
MPSSCTCRPRSRYARSAHHGHGDAAAPRGHGLDGDDAAAALQDADSHGGSCRVVLRGPVEDRFHFGHVMPTLIFITFSSVNEALRRGYRGLPGGSSIAQHLAERREHRNVGRLRDLTEERVIQWEDEDYDAIHP